MLGNPRYKENDIVQFKITQLGHTHILTGTIYIVDAYGTFFQTEEPSYDILVEDSPFVSSKCLYKHVPESLIIQEVEL